MILQEAFTKGIEAAQNAEANRAEILTVINDLSNVLKKYLGVDCNLDLVNQQILRPGRLGVPEYVDTGWEFVTLFIDGKTNEQLFKIKMSEDGYPVTVKYQAMDETAFDKNAFEATISEVVSNTTFGKKLYQLKLSLEA